MNYTKKQALEHWESLPDGLDPMPHFEAIPYKSKGSTYGACGIRVDGTPEFIDAVLSRLKPLLQGENGATRLALSRRDAPTGFKPTPNACVGESEVCYIRLHERGREAQICNALFGR